MASPTDTNQEQPAPDSPEHGPNPLSRGALVKLHLRLLELEQKADASRRLKLSGLDRLEGLVVAETRWTPHGLRLWVLRPRGGRDVPLPRNSIRARDCVTVSTKPSDASHKAVVPNVTCAKPSVNRSRNRKQQSGVAPTAVVQSTTGFELTLVMDKNKKLVLHQTVDVNRLHDDSTYWRMRAALEQLKSVSSGLDARLQAALFAEGLLEPAASLLPPQLVDADGKLRLFNSQLDTSQREAVEFALRQPRLAVIHGPPGTGKTTTAVETILQHVELEQRVLVCAASNVAVDNLLMELWDAGMENMVRLGHPARIEESLLDFWLDNRADALLEEWDNRLSKYWEDRRGEKNNRKRTVIEEADVVFCTLAVASQKGPLMLTEHGGTFDLLVIDECSQALEAACWLAVPRVRKLLLFGDHHQLPPTLMSQAAARQGLAVSLLERQVTLHGDAVVRQLRTQYRMHELIQQWSSDNQYGGMLHAAPAVLRHRLSQLEGVKDTEDTGPILLLIDTAGCHLTEAAADETGSRRNDGEADIVAAHVAALVQDGVRQDQIGVITPYKAQTTCILTALRRLNIRDVEVSSVDGFQGREKEVVLLSLVRSNNRGMVGFLADQHRINVAVTRARRQLCVVCDSDTICAVEVLGSLVTYLRGHGEVRSARGYERHLSRAALRRFRQGSKDPGSSRGPGASIVFRRSKPNY